MKRKLFALFLTLVMVVSLVPVTALADDAPEEFVITDNGLLTAYNGPGGDVVIPDGVTAVGAHAFGFREDIISVDLGRGVTKIGERAFERCYGLTSVTFGPSVSEIGYKAFEKCTGLTSVTIPANVRTVADFAFSGCTNLETVIIESGSTIYDSASFGMAKLILPDGFSDFEFENGVLTRYLGSDRNVVIPEGVTSIRNSAFYGNNNITSITIPSTVTEIGKSAFANCRNLTQVNFVGAPKVLSDMLFDGCTSLTSIVIPDSVEELGSSCFGGCSNLQVVSLPDSLTSIGSYAFRNCPLTYVNFPSRLTTIGASAFAGASLTSVAIPDSVTSMGDGVFQNCKSLRSLTIGSRLKELPGSAFADCSALTSAVIPDTVTTIGERVFSGCSNLRSLTISRNIKAIPDRAFGDCDFTSITIPSSVTSIGNGAFSNCDSLTSVVIPEGVTSIGSAAFRACYDLKIVSLPGSLTSIGEEAFCHCKSLTSVSTLSGVRSMGKSVFENCPALTDVTLGDQLVQIPARAFYGCSGLRKLVIPDSVKAVGNDAFTGCTSLSDVAAPAALGLSLGKAMDQRDFTITDYGKELTKYNGYSSSVVIPDGVKVITASVFAGRTNITSVVIPDTVTTIQDCAFDGCTGLTSIVIPDSVTKLSNSAFRGCVNLTDIRCPERLRTLAQGYKISEDGTTLLSYAGPSATPVVPSGVRRIYSAFDSLDYVTKVTLPDTVVYVSGGAFFCCKNLTDVVFPASITSISYKAVATGVPENEVSHGYSEPVAKVTVHGAAGSYAETWAASVMSGSDPDAGMVQKPAYPFVADQPWSVSGESTQHRFIVDGKYLIRYEGPGGDVVVPDGLGITLVYNPAGMENVTSLTLPHGVESVNLSASGLAITKLRSITVQEGAKSVRIDLPQLEKLVLPDTVTALYVTSTALKEMNVPRYVTELALKCPNLKEAFIPKTLTNEQYVYIFWKDSPRKLIFEEGSSLYRGRSFTGFFKGLNCGRLETIVNNPSRTWENHMAPNEALRDSWTNPYADLKPQTARVTKLSNEICQGCTTEYEKARAISRWIVKNIEYDEDYYYFGLKTYADVPFNPDDVLASGMAVCAGYARLTQAMLAAQGIPCLYVTGWTNAGYHAWNLAYVDGEYIWMDNTWGMGYFGLGTATISLNHIASGAAVFDNVGVISSMEPDLPEDVQQELDAEKSVMVNSTPSTSQWAKDEVEAARKAGLIPVDLQNNYQSAITRLDFCRAMVKLVESYTGKDVDDYINEKGLAVANPFEDIDHEDVLAAYALGIVKGTGDTTFTPYDSISRQEAATMLMRTAKVLGKTNAGRGLNFVDKGSFASWAEEGITFVSGLKTSGDQAVMGGVGNDLFDPLGIYTREQAFMTSYRLFVILGEM